MTNDFVVNEAEILLVDEPGFLAHGGQSLAFGMLHDGTVQMHAVGSLDAIRCLARDIIAHHTAAH
jgi:hypothetical protein